MILILGFALVIFIVAFAIILKKGGMKAIRNLYFPARKINFFPLALSIGFIHFFVSYLLFGFLFAMGDAGEKSITLDVFGIILSILIFPMAIMQKIFPNPPISLNTFMILFSIFLGSLFWGIFIPALILLIQNFGKRKTRQFLKRPSRPSRNSGEFRGHDT